MASVNSYTDLWKLQQQNNTGTNGPRPASSGYGAMIQPTSGAMEYPTGSRTGTAATATTASNTVPSDYTGADRPYTGWLAGYAPGALRDIIYDAPQFLLQDVMNRSGVGYTPGNALYNQLAELSGADPLSLWAMLAGNGISSFAEGTDNAYGNWLAALYYNQMMPGGGNLDFSKMMSNIFSMAPGSSSSPNESVLYNLLTSGNATQQVSNLYNMVRDAARVGLNPLAATAALTAMERAGTQYLGSMARGGAGAGGDNGVFYNWLRENAPGLVGAFTL